jgi:ABC-type Fe3+/spermidine/putrescine transport system ATPase subunit
MIELHNIRFNRDKFSLKVEELKIVEGKKMVLVGASGSGKTTLLRLLSGLEERFEGEYYIDGEKDLKELNQRGVMFLSQDFLLWEHLSVIEHLNFVLNGGKSLKEHQESIIFLEMVGLSYKKESKISQLSTGERQRLALARALSAKAKYLFLDEPFSNIDVVLAHELIEIIEERQKIDRFAFVQSTHHHLGFKRDHTQIVILSRGEIIQQGEWNEIQQNPKNRWVEQWVDLVS